MRRLVDDLKARNLNVWFDERNLQVGDSIVTGINQGLREADYLIVVLSQASAQSLWVQAELNAAFMDQMVNRGVAVLPVRIDDYGSPPTAPQHCLRGLPARLLSFR